MVFLHQQSITQHQSKTLFTGSCRPKNAAKWLYLFLSKGALLQAISLK
jgi:hypothetical protein